MTTSFDTSDAAFAYNFRGRYLRPARHWINPDGSRGGIVAEGAHVAKSAWIHSGAAVEPGVTIGEGAEILAGAAIAWEAFVGDGARIGELATIGHKCRVEAGAEIAHEAELHYAAFVGAQSIVGPFAHVGYQAIVGRNSRIGHSCKVGGDAEIGDGVRLGYRVCVISGHGTAKTIIRDGAVIGCESKIEAGSIVGPGVVVGERTYLNGSCLAPVGQGPSRSRSEQAMADLPDDGSAITVFTPDGVAIDTFATQEARDYLAEHFVRWQARSTPLVHETRA